MCCKMRMDLSRKRIPFQRVSIIPAVGPEHCHLHDIGRVKYTSVTDAGALEGLQLLAKVRRNYSCSWKVHMPFSMQLNWQGQMGEEEILVICLSGRGDKDVQTVRDALGGGLND